MGDGGTTFRWCLLSWSWSSSTTSSAGGVNIVLHVLWCLLVFCAMMETMAKRNVDAASPAATIIKSTNTICQMNGCNCTSEHKYWHIVNCSFDNKQIIELDVGILPASTIELSITGGHSLKLNAHLFTALRNFQRLRTDNTRNIVVKKHAFLNLTDTSLLVQLTGCDSLVFETAAFKNILGPLSAEISRCGHVTIQQSSFSFLQSLTFQDILLLELAEGAFTLPIRELGHHGAVTTIKFRQVIVPSLPKDVFKSSLAEVSFTDSEIRDVLPGAFSANTIAAIIVTNSSVHRIRARAFSDRTYLDSLSITGCRLHLLETQAMLSAMTKLTVQHSKVNLIETGAINATIAKVILNSNKIGQLHSHGFVIHEWNQIVIENNVFERLDEYSMDVPFKYLPMLDQYEFTFNDNEIGLIETGALKFFSNIMPNVSNSRFENNYFRFTCHCEIEKWLEEKLGDSCNSFSTNNYCTIDSMLAQCYDVTEGRMNMRNYTDTFCDNGSDLKCKTFSPDANIAVNKQYARNADNNNLILGLVLGSVFLIAVCGTIVILLIHGGVWLKRKGYCARFKTFHYRPGPDESSNSRETEQDIMVTMDKDSNSDSDPDHLPEELTQDLLQTLRLKLEDPLTYNEAREMIERLYDHFIIEDSYATNNNTAAAAEETHLYEELANHNSETNRAAAAAAATRPFSFLRLIEERFNLTPGSESGSNNNNNNNHHHHHRPSVLADEYSEPTDTEIHLYSELPQNFKEGKQNEINEGLTQRSNSSGGSMLYRPLPDKPESKRRGGGDPGEGPSTQL